jgi:hypothetical protein
MGFRKATSENLAKLVFDKGETKGGVVGQTIVAENADLFQQLWGLCLSAFRGDIRG